MEHTSGANSAVRTALNATYAMPGYLLGIYALLMLALGWFAHQRWGEKSPAIIAAHAAPSSAAIGAPSPERLAAPSLAAVANTPNAIHAAPDAATPVAKTSVVTTSAVMTPAAAIPAVTAPAATTSAAATTSPAATADTAVAAPPESAKPAPHTLRVVDGQLPPLTYSAHVFTTDPDKRSITLNGVRYREGESPMDGLVIEQIQQDVTLFDVNGDVFILDALSDWPGGDIREAETN